jgi:hypothetical protein
MKEHYAETPGNAGRFADSFVNAAKNITGQVLDYSPSSVGIVDSIIESMRNQGAPIHKMQDTFFSMGCYIGEVFVKNGHARWVLTKSTPIKNFSSSEIMLQLSPTSYCNPIDKVLKRVENGAEDSLVHFYEIFSAKSAPISPQKTSWLGKLFGG